MAVCPVCVDLAQGFSQVVDVNNFGNLEELAVFSYEVIQLHLVVDDEECLPG